MRLIDADKMRENLEWCKSQSGRYNDIYWDDVIERLDVQPTVDAAPVKHGQWIPVLNGIDDDTNPAFDCSECDAMCNKKHNYCPACGAKMDLEEQDAQLEQSGK